MWFYPYIQNRQQKLPRCLELVSAHEQRGIIAHHVPEQSLVGIRQGTEKLALYVNLISTGLKSIFVPGYFA